KGIGSDSRIGYSFIYPGCGYGGSCFPKDIKALIKTSESAGFSPLLLSAVEKRNAAQKNSLFEKVSARFGNNLAGLTFAVWGLSFKPGTDDMREAPSLVLIKSLISAGACVRAYDPVAEPQADREFPGEWMESGKIVFCSHQYAALENADAMFLVTEWKPFRQPDFIAMKKIMKAPVIFDGRNQYDPLEMKELGFEYVGIGRIENSAGFNQKDKTVYKNSAKTT
uniref:UDP-glucose/GDP-mannose dehydrogenase family protein n=1 Tax=Desulforegula conservatrix TaxID=153026 RepID=UPI0018DC3160